MIDNSPKAFKNFFIKIKTKSDLSGTNGDLTIRHITNKILDIKGKDNDPVNVGSLGFLSKENTLIVFCILNDRSLSKRPDTLEKIIYLDGDLEIEKIESTTLFDLIEIFKNCIRDGFRLISIPK